MAFKQYAGVLESSGMADVHEKWSMCPSAQYSQNWTALIDWFLCMLESLPTAPCAYI